MIPSPVLPGFPIIFISYKYKHYFAYTLTLTHLTKVRCIYSNAYVVSHVIKYHVSCISRTVHNPSDRSSVRRTSLPMNATYKTAPDILFRCWGVLTKGNKKRKEEEEMQPVISAKITYPVIFFYI